MSDIVISVQGLGKSYRMAASRGTPAYRMLTDEIASAPQRLVSLLKGRGTPPEIFWALKDVSFDVRQGEVVGIIGRNGAGKSTLLKILSRITPPTEGRAEIHGRVGSLLEVGTGFHPELSGRENVFLNGAILGMARTEIQKKFDEIVAFAEVEKFIDTPVKHYSSGMYVRLAFAVAAHLDSEVLLVDEVLAVGDAKFQKKCIGKMGDVVRMGKTVFFVSHNVESIGALCPRTILLNEGRVIAHGGSRDVIARYSGQLEQAGINVITDTQEISFKGIGAGAPRDIPIGGDINLKALFRSASDIDNARFDLALINKKGAVVVHAVWDCVNQRGADLKKGQDFVLTFDVRSPCLMPGLYDLAIYATAFGRVLFWADNIPALNVTPDGRFGDAGYAQIQAPIVPEVRISVADQ